MNRAICKLSFRESAIWIAPVVILLGIWILLAPSPFRYFDAATSLLGLALGFLLGFRIFWDGGGVRPFLFSCAFSPTRLFTVRWLFGMAIIIACWLMVALLIASGIRQTTQVALFSNGWYPMVRWMELQVLFCFIISTLLAYQGTVLLVVWHRFQGRQRFKGFARASRIVLTILFTLSLVPVVVGIGAFLVMNVFYSAFSTSVQEMPMPYSALPWAMLNLGVPALVQTLIVPFAGRFCYRNMEIES